METVAKLVHVASISVDQVRVGFQRPVHQVPEVSQDIRVGEGGGGTIAHVHGPCHVMVIQVSTSVGGDVGDTVFGQGGVERFKGIIFSLDKLLKNRRGDDVDAVEQELHAVEFARRRRRTDSIEE
jgi:hypothetical protein